MPPSSAADRLVEGALGAYGLKLTGVEAARSLLGPAEAGWPALELLARVGPVSAEPESVGGERANLRTRSGVQITIERGPGRAVFCAPRRLSAHELIHPHLAAAAAVAAYWAGRESVHGGAFALEGRAWALLGERGSGKSSTLAGVALRGVSVISDDLLVLGDLLVFPGPRCVDLREEVAGALGAGEPLGRVGERERWRLSLTEPARALPLAGVVVLEWGERLETVPLQASRLLAALLRHRGLRVPPADSERMLDLAALPAWELRRPRRLESLAAAVDRLLELAGG